MLGGIPDDLAAYVLRIRNDFDAVLMALENRSEVQVHRAYYALRAEQSSMLEKLETMYRQYGSAQAGGAGLFYAAEAHKASGTHFCTDQYVEPVPPMNLSKITASAPTSFNEDSDTYRSRYLDPSVKEGDQHASVPPSPAPLALFLGDEVGNGCGVVSLDAVKHIVKDELYSQPLEGEETLGGDQRRALTRNATQAFTERYPMLYIKRKLLSPSREDCSRTNTEPPFGTWRAPPPLASHASTDTPNGRVAAAPLPSSDRLIETKAARTLYEFIEFTHSQGRPEIDTRDFSTPPEHVTTSIVETHTSVPSSRGDTDANLAEPRERMTLTERQPNKPEAQLHYSCKHNISTSTSRATPTSQQFWIYVWPCFGSHAGTQRPERVLVYASYRYMEDLTSRASRQLHCQPAPSYLFEPNGKVIRRLDQLVPEQHYLLFPSGGFYRQEAVPTALLDALVQSAKEVLRERSIA